jgi:SAM-dependent methyltransferase
MKTDSLYAYFVSEYEKPFTGWDFSHIEKRMTEDPLPWDYGAMVRELLPDASALLDMGTGGGEFLSSLAPLPDETYATEGYTPNIPVARERLEPLGVGVVAVDSERLPFNDETFSHVINRHESFDVNELYRVLKPGGIFLTQQVGGDNDIDINRALSAPMPPYMDWNLTTAVSALEKAGFILINQREHYYLERYHDTGALLYYLKAIPWQVDDFAIDKYYDKLVAIHNEIREEGFFSTRTHRFLIQAVKPAS